MHVYIYAHKTPLFYFVQMVLPLNFKSYTTSKYHAQQNTVWRQMKCTVRNKLNNNVKRHHMQRSS